MEKIILVRHANYRPDESFNPHLSEKGLENAMNLSKSIQKELECQGENIIIWTSPTNRTMQTAEIIKKELKIPEDNFFVQDKLSTDLFQKVDCLWLKNKINDMKNINKNLIIVTHAEYVGVFPQILCHGFGNQNIGLAQGVLIYNGKATLLNYSNCA